MRRPLEGQCPLSATKRRPQHAACVRRRRRYLRPVGAIAVAGGTCGRRRAMVATRVDQSTHAACVHTIQEDCNGPPPLVSSTGGLPLRNAPGAQPPLSGKGAMQPTAASSDPTRFRLELGPPSPQRPRPRARFALLSAACSCSKARRVSSSLCRVCSADAFSASSCACTSGNFLCISCWSSRWRPPHTVRLRLMRA